MLTVLPTDKEKEDEAHNDLEGEGDSTDEQEGLEAEVECADLEHAVLQVSITL